MTGDEINLTWGKVFAGMGLLATIHAAVIVPSILYASGGQADEKIATHEQHPHPGAVTRHEFLLLTDAIDKLHGSIEDLRAEILAMRGQK